MYEYEINYGESEIPKIPKAEALARTDFGRTGIAMILEEQIIN